MNHRYGLDDAILIKDNHIAVAGGVKAALKAAKHAAGHMVVIEIEVDTLAQLDEAIAAGADIVLLDNMKPDMLREAVRRAGNRVKTEASGGVTLGDGAGHRRERRRHDLGRRPHPLGAGARSRARCRDQLTDRRAAAPAS